MRHRIGQKPGFSALTRATKGSKVAPALAEAEVRGAGPPLPIEPPTQQPHEAPVAKGGPSSNLIAARQSAFSRPAESLAVLLADQSKQAASFLEHMLDALTFFGGARIQPGHPHYQIAEAYGEALLLANVAPIDAGLFSKALKSGLFSTGAVSAAKAVVTSLAAASLPPAQLAHAFSVAGGDPERLAGALAQLIPPAELNLRPRTGAGPGIMHAVAKGYVEARTKLLGLAPPAAAKELAAGLKAQGSRMGGNLPFEQKASDAIEDMGIFLHFIPRRLALTEGAPAFSIFPGGIGTLNELFEVMRMDRTVVFEGRAFWSDAVERLQHNWNARGLVDPAEPPSIAFADGVSEGLPVILEAIHAAGPKNVRSIVADIESLSHDLHEGPMALKEVATAVTFVGGKRLRPSDPEVHAARALAEQLGRSQVPMRLGGPGALFDAVHSGNQSAQGPSLQAFLLDDGKLDRASVEKRADVGYVAKSAIAHKPLMYENNVGIVALPGGVGTMDEVFEIACLISTGNAPKRPLVLVGREFWAPLIDAFEKAMDPASTDPAVMRAVAKGEFRRLFDIVDTADEARAALEAPAKEAAS